MTIAYKDVAKLPFLHRYTSKMMQLNEEVLVHDEGKQTTDPNYFKQISLCSISSTVRPLNGLSWKTLRRNRCLYNIYVWDDATKVLQAPMTALNKFYLGPFFCKATATKLVFYYIHSPK